MPVKLRVVTIFFSTVAQLVLTASGGLPASGGPYLIHNAQTGFVFDDHIRGTAAGNPINGFTINPTSGKPAQYIFVQQTGTCGDSGIYTFILPTLGLGIYANGRSGGGLTAQNFSTSWFVTEIVAGTGVFVISFPFTNLAVTTSNVSETQLTLQPASAVEPRQQWSFLLQSDVCATVGSSLFHGIS